MKCVVEIVKCFFDSVYSVGSSVSIPYRLEDNGALVHVVLIALLTANLGTPPPSRACL